MKTKALHNLNAKYVLDEEKIAKAKKLSGRTRNDWRWVFRRCSTKNRKYT